MRSSTLLVTAFGAGLAIATYAVVTPSGLARWRALDGERAQLQAELELLQTRNDALARDIEVLRGDTPDTRVALARAVRQELGWIAPDEVVLLMPPSTHPSSAAPAAAPAPERRSE
jgi:cell division protein FtsB